MNLSIIACFWNYSISLMKSMIVFCSYQFLFFDTPLGFIILAFGFKIMFFESVINFVMLEHLRYKLVLILKS
jgi:hypothetical protein